VPAIGFHAPRLRLASTVLACWAVIGVSLASACTIPVFRYALERWESDRFLVIVYDDGRLTADENSEIEELAQRSSIAGGPLNIEVIRYGLNATSPPKLLDVQPPSADRPLPWVEVRSRLNQTRTALRWQGSLAEAIALPGLFDSPARQEIVRRILSGHSSVWLLIAPEEQAHRLSEQLQSSLDGVTSELTLPQGIGLPGSELYASIPLEIRYSVLPVSHTDPKEQQFLKWLAALAPKWRTDTAYVVPVFGRCRALDVFPYAEADVPLIEDVASFVCGACSCQVKQANPGFDLLASVNWEQRLFGESILHGTGGLAQPSGDLTPSGPPDSPEYLAIPAGNQQALTSQSKRATEKAERSSIEADRAVGGGPTAPSAPTDFKTLHRLPNTVKLVLLLVVLTLVNAGVLTGILLSR
jgi:hypothetical protein